MRLFQIEKSNNSFQLLDNKKELVGELLSGFLSGLNSRIKIGNEFYKIKAAGFLWMAIDVFDESGRLILKIDSAKNRIFYYGDSTEIYTYKYKGWLHKKLFLYDNNDQLVLAIDYRQALFKLNYKLEIDDNFNNGLITLSLLYFYLRDLLSE